MLESFGIIIVIILLSICIPQGIILLGIGYFKKNQSFPFTKIGLASLGLSAFVFIVFLLYYFVLSLQIENTTENISGEYVLKSVQINSHFEKLVNNESGTTYLLLNSDSTFHLNELPFLKIAGEGHWKYYFLDGHFVSLDFSGSQNMNGRFYGRQSEFLCFHKDSIKVTLEKRWE